MGRSAGGRGNATNLDNTELAAVDNISVFILPSIVNNVGHIGSRDRLGLHTYIKLGIYYVYLTSVHIIFHDT